MVASRTEIDDTNGGAVLVDEEDVFRFEITVNDGRIEAFEITEDH